MMHRCCCEGYPLQHKIFSIEHIYAIQIVGKIASIKPDGFCMHKQYSLSITGNAHVFNCDIGAVDERKISMVSVE